MSKIIVEDYNENWKYEFFKAKAFYLKLLEGIDIRIEHVGSTSVEGLWAKAILDIDIIVKNTDVSSAVIKRLESVDYEHIGNNGIEGREAFTYKEDNRYIDWMTHHLYVCLDGCENLQNHLALKHHLQNNKSAVEAYSALKRA